MFSISFCRQTTRSIWRERRAYFFHLSEFIKNFCILHGRGSEVNEDQQTRPLVAITGAFAGPENLTRILLDRSEHGVITSYQQSDGRCEALFTRLKKVGDSHALMLDQTILDQVGLGEGDEVRLSVQQGSIVISPANPAPVAQDSFDACLQRVVVERQEALRRLVE